MSEPKWTPAQRAAIEDRGGALLVSAAAGSGKTAVLTERAVRLITDPEHPVDADRLLIVTFTNAAAAELRARIGQALLRLSVQQPHNTALRRQRMLLQRAPICTIDAFCLDLLHKHFQALDIPPDFAPADPGSVEVLRASALAETLENAYRDPDFCAFADLYGKGRTDQAAGNTILHVYDFLRALPDYDRRMDEYLAPWQQENGFGSTCWHDLLLAEAARCAGAARELLTAALADCREDFALAQAQAEEKGKTAASKAKAAAGVNDKFAEPLSRLENAAALLGELLLSPSTRGGLLLPQYVDSEREKLLDIIRSRMNDKRSYALTRCIEEMCCYEDFAVSRFGSESEAENIHYKKLTRHYRELIQTCPVEIFYCGKTDFKAVSAAMRDAFSAMPRGEIDYDIGTDLRMNAVEDHVRFVEEEMDVTQGKLSMGWRASTNDAPAMMLANLIFGGYSNSKLFLNVREKLSLCYYASSAYHRSKGIVTVSSGIECRDVETAKREILAQLASVQRGEFEEWEVEGARACLIASLESRGDSAGRMEENALGQAATGIRETADELIAALRAVTNERIAEAAQSMTLDTVYFLTGEDSKDE